ncbi:unnamed protein product [Lepeophtheirus salmonis]|uniref:(salmon louse) hypothetical protein n=1 Tax=Lepeophtheirus salmonis TaxID=72036 RepID=A0A7R8H4L8_LEPSM|nr:unnamed protein product [Lepeophtheirus salmonis]CAF2862620.1 unnamed protein product [Lepeophtheirus salmonis]
MKLIHYITFVQILVLFVDFCSATLYVPKFRGSWCEDKAERRNVSDVMKLIGLSDELIKQYEVGRPGKLDIDYKPLEDVYIVNGTDPIAHLLNWTFERNQKEKKAEQIFGQKESPYRSPTSNPEKNVVV